MNQWTAIIPAAGTGSRLGYNIPKILVPVRGRPVLYHIAELLLPHCQELIVVASPGAADDIQEHINLIAPDRITQAAQSHANGTAYAVAIGLRKVKTENVLVLWGDEVNTRPETLAHAMSVHAAVTVPTALVPDPYVHYVRTNTGKIHAVAQRREGTIQMPATGEQDIGLFLFRTWILQRYLDMLLLNGRRGVCTKEMNFIDIFPYVDKEGDVTVKLLPIASALETVSINTREELAQCQQS